MRLIGWIHFHGIITFQQSQPHRYPNIMPVGIWIRSSPGYLWLHSTGNNRNHQKWPKSCSDSRKRPAERPNGDLKENQRYLEFTQDMGDLWSHWIGLVWPRKKGVIREASPYQNGWIFGKVPNGLWPPSFSENYLAIFSPKKALFKGKKSAT